MMKQFDHMIERKLNPRLKFLAGCGQFSDFSNKTFCEAFVVEFYLKLKLIIITYNIIPNIYMLGN